MGVGPDTVPSSLQGYLQGLPFKPPLKGRFKGASKGGEFFSYFSLFCLLFFGESLFFVFVFFLCFSSPFLPWDRPSPGLPNISHFFVLFRHLLEGRLQGPLKDGGGERRFKGRIGGRRGEKGRVGGREAGLEGEALRGSPFKALEV